MDVAIPPEFEAYARAQVEAGTYRDEAEAVAAALAITSRGWRSCGRRPAKAWLRSTEVKASRERARCAR